MIPCNKCKNTTYSIHGKCLSCGNIQFKSKAKTINDVNTVVDNMTADAVERVIMAMVKVNVCD